MQRLQRSSMLAKSRPRTARNGRRSKSAKYVLEFVEQHLNNSGGQTADGPARIRRHYVLDVLEGPTSDIGDGGDLALTNHAKRAIRRTVVLDP
jgi:hypothetical protein